MKTLKALLVTAMLLGAAVVAFSQAITVKNYFTQCSGVACDNALNIGGTLQYRNRGTVTQITSISTGVTLNATSGTITTVSQTVAGAAEATFVVTNSTVAAADNIFLTVGNAGAGVFIGSVSNIGAGSFTITLSNVDAAAGNSVLTINFLVIKSLA